MKALANGSLNLSVLDGWWDEGYNRAFGWGIGHGEEYKDHAIQDNIESLDLYNLLEKEVIPLFYERGHDEIPRRWVQKMKAGLKYLVPIFNSHRMVQEYMDRYYLPCSKRYDVLSRNDFAESKELASWRQKLMTSWAEVAVDEVSATDGKDIFTGSDLEITTKVRLGNLEPHDVTVEVYYGRLNHNEEFSERETRTLEVKDSKDGIHTYKGTIPCADVGRFGYTVRVMPSQERLENRFVMGLVTWAK
jgi:starch phosphorylase